MTTTIEDGINELLLAQPAIAGMVGNRIYPNEAKEGSAFPRIVYSVTGNSRTHAMSGPDGAPAMLLLLDCQGSYDQSKNLADAVRLAMDGYRGYAGQHWIKGCFFEDQSDQPESPVRGEEKAIKVRQVVMTISYSETVNQLNGA